MLRLDQLKREVLFESIVEAIGEMPDLLRQAFILSHYKGLSEKEIAVHVGVDEQKVRFLLGGADSFLSEKLRPLIATDSPGSPQQPQDLPIEPAAREYLGYEAHAHPHLQTPRSSPAAPDEAPDND